VARSLFDDFVRLREQRGGCLPDGSSDLVLQSPVWQAAKREQLTVRFYPTPCWYRVLPSGTETRLSVSSSIRVPARFPGGFSSPSPYCGLRIADRDGSVRAATGQPGRVSLCIRSRRACVPNGFNRNPATPNCVTRSHVRASPCAVIRIVGMVNPSATIRSYRSNPLIPPTPRWMSRTKQAVRPTL
jgi:hypothetical protein